MPRIAKAKQPHMVAPPDVAPAANNNDDCVTPERITPGMQANLEQNSFSPAKDSDERSAIGLGIRPLQPSSGDRPIESDVTAEELEIEAERREAKKVLRMKLKGKSGNTTAKQYGAARSKWWGAFVAYAKWSAEEAMVWLDDDKGEVIAAWRFRRVTCFAWPYWHTCSHGVNPPRTHGRWPCASSCPRWSPRREPAVVEFGPGSGSSMLFLQQKVLRGSSVRYLRSAHNNITITMEQKKWVV